MTWTRPSEDCTTTDCVRIEAAGDEPGMGYETIETNDLDEAMGMENVELVLLSFFDGIGAAHVALANLGVEPCFAMSFETDEECKSVIRARFPDVEVVGSYDLYKAEELMGCVKAATEAADDFVILVTAGPPCQDFSRIKGRTSKGRTGPEGEKFVKFCELLHSLRAAAAAHARRWAFHFVVENVLMNAHETHYFDKQLGAQAFIMDAGDMTRASRQRFWWTSFLNGEESALRMAKKDIPTLTWLARVEGAPFNLTLPIEKLDPTSLVWGNVTSASAGNVAWAGPCTLHESVQRGDRKVPTFTTPAPDSGGRGAPEGSLQKCSEGAKLRWHGDLRRFAPWQYGPHAMLSAAAQHCVNMPATVKEVPMGFQPRFTASGKDGDVQNVVIPPTSRHRMLANTWHVGVAQAVLYMFLVLALAASVKAATPIPPQPRPTCLGAPHHCLVRRHAESLGGACSRSSHGSLPHGT